MVLLKKKIRSLFTVNYNKSSKACNPCALECKKIEKKVSNRKLSEIKNEEIAHILNVFEKKD